MVATMEYKSYEIGWKTAHFADLAKYIMRSDISCHFNNIVILRMAEYLLVYDSENNILAGYIEDEGLWIFSLDVTSGEYSCHTTYHMQAALVEIFFFVSVGNEEE